MAGIKTPQKVKFFFGIITQYTTELIPVIKKVIERRFGKIDIESQTIPFNFTDYYTKDMETNLKRVFLSLEKLYPPDLLATLKKWTNYIEFTCAKENKYGLKRLINIDPGYISLSKLVLASTKDYSHRIHLRGGIYAEITLIYRNKKFTPLQWTYPDYKTSDYLNFFYEVREKLKRTAKLLAQC